MDDSVDIDTMLRRSAEDFVAAAQGSQRRSRVCGESRDIDRAVWSQMAELGWLGLAVPESMGGSGMGVLEASALCDVFGRSLFPEPYLAAALLPASVLASADADRGQQPVTELGSLLSSGRRPFALAWQEARGEVEPLAPSTFLVDGRLHGKKCFVHGVQADSVLLVSAQAGADLVIVAIDASADGVTVETEATAQGNVSRLRFAGAVPLDDSPLLRGAPAYAALCKSLEFARIAASAQLAGLARGCLEKTIAYVGQRVQFGHALGAFQTVAHRCVDLHISVEMSDASWRHAALSHAMQSADAGVAACAAKARCSDVAREVGRVAVQLHGAMGFTEEVRIGQYLRVSMQYAAWLGGSTGLRRSFVSRSAELQEEAHAAA